MTLSMMKNGIINDDEQYVYVMYGSKSDPDNWEINEFTVENFLEFGFAIHADGNECSDDVWMSSVCVPFRCDDPIGHLNFFVDL